MSCGTLGLEEKVAGDQAPNVARCPPGDPPDQCDNGQPPFREPGRGPATDAARVGMLIFLGAETMLFAGFIAAFLVFRLGAPVWPPPFQPRLPIGVTGVNTVVLLLSGYTMWRTLRALEERKHAQLVQNLLKTGFLGAVFVAVQGYEWARLMEFGLTARSGIYGGTFYTLIGAHAVHVLGALTWLAAIVVGTVQRRVGRAALQAFSMYWTFVVCLWPILYTLVYLV